MKSVSSILIGKLACVFICAAAFAAMFVFEVSIANAADRLPWSTTSGDVKPIVAGIQASQMGGDSLLFRVRGNKMPLPTVVSKPGDPVLVLRWNGVRYPQNTDRRDWWDNYDWSVLTLGEKNSDKWFKQFDLPLLERINVEKDDEEDAMFMYFTGPRPLSVSDIVGTAGADSVAIMLKVYEEPKPMPVAKPVKIRPQGDPLAIDAKVTMQIRDGDVRSVFRMLAEQQKLNLLLDPSVPDMTVTFSFKDVPYKEAFSYLLRMCDLNYAMVGGMLVVGREESLGRTLGNEVTKGYRLSYAIDEKGSVTGDLTATLTGLVKLSTVPTIDNRNRTLYVTATPEQHEEVARILEKLDHPGKQIMIQAQIIEVNDDGKQELETLVSAVYDQWLVNFSNTGLSVGYNSINGGNAFDAVDPDLPLAGAPVGSDQSLGNIALDSGMRMLSAGLRAIESKGYGKVLANPSVITVDGEEARVELTQNYKYASGVDSNGNTTFSNVESGPKLMFTPVIGRNGVITIKVQVETGEIVQFRYAGNGAVAPETTSRKVETLVRVRDGEPFAVGGLYGERRTRNRARIPVLGYIPLLGDLFTTRNDQHVKSEVAMVIIPYVLDIPNEEIATFELERAPLGH